MVTSQAKSAPPEIKVIYPEENALIPPVFKSFVIGSVTPNSKLTINGDSVKVHKNGAFLAMIPFKYGDFSIKLVAKNKNGITEFERNVRVEKPLSSTNIDTLLIDDEITSPWADFILQHGDTFDIVFKGTPGCKASFKIGKREWEYKMNEETEWNVVRDSFEQKRYAFGSGSISYDTIRGIYRATYKIRPEDSFIKDRIIFILRNEKGEEVRKESSGTITVSDSFMLAETIDDNVKVRVGPGLFYPMILPKGVRLIVSGKIGKYYRVRLSKDEDGWVDDKDIEIKKGDYEIPVKQKINGIRIEDSGKKIQVLIPMKEKLPFKVEHNIFENSLLLSIYGALSDTDIVRIGVDTSLIRQVSCAQKGEDIYQLKINLGFKQLWGYKVLYLNSSLILSVRKPPLIPKRGNVFKNIVIMLDPGHSKDTGAVGPTELMEKDVNWDISWRLKKILQREGAKVFLSREKEEDVTLEERPKRGIEKDCEIFVSIHNNAFPDGVDPYYRNGYSVYYYQPHSLELAKEIHLSYQKNLNIPDYGLYLDNLAVCRETAHISVVTESAFIIIPEQEILLRKSSFLWQCARAIFLGIKSFLEKNRG